MSGYQHILKAALALAAVSLFGQQHDHARVVHGVPGGVPQFCANPTATSVTSGSWSDPATWSGGKVPGAADRVAISAGHQVAYDSSSEIACLDLQGHLKFATDRNTRLKTRNLMVEDEGFLEIGSESQPISATVTAEIIIADQKIDRELDPAELGAGIEALGKVRMHGALKAPTFVRLREEPHAGQATLVADQVLEGWRPGDRIAIPDTRQLRDAERGGNYTSQDEKIEIASVGGELVTLAGPLRFDHRGARDADGKLDFLPHIGNVSRNIVIRSENPRGTRGHMIFMSRSDVDLRYVEVRDMGRTRTGVLDSTEFDAANRVSHLGTNQIGRYPIHFHHNFGPKQTPANGYQFTLIGCSVDSAPKWGVTVHNTHYGLVRDNIVYNAQGSGIVTEDGTESYNVFEHNFSLRTAGSGEFAPRSGYSGAGPDPGGEGSGFWFRGPNNYIRNNVSANADVFGYDLAAGSLDTIRVPAFKGGDTSLDAETKALETTSARVLEFTGNEAYGALQTGVAFGWNGEIRDFRVWHAARHGVTAEPTDELVADRVTVRGDRSALAAELESPAGVWVGNYASKSVTILNADIQGMRTGVSSPFVHAGGIPEPGRGDSSLVVENGRFCDDVGVVIGTSYRAGAPGDRPLKRAVVRSSIFAPLDVPVLTMYPPAAISMTYRMAPGDTDPRDPVTVVDFNRTAGDNFKVYYSLEAPSSVSPCSTTRANLDGWVCK